eukprot:gb/GECG01003930.1/.p1 GENE.gb/GECG01003930.1/~~gb/GECG01003930.1/.p1  ORF type:complete len:102 (+),score=12.19 gb/GECG01003930.1/:1-306(+)
MIYEGMEIASYVFIGLFGSVSAVGIPLFYRYWRRSNCSSSCTNSDLVTTICRFSTEVRKNGNSNIEQNGQSPKNKGTEADSPQRESDTKQHDQKDSNPDVQ